MKRTSTKDLAKKLNIRPSRALESQLKAQLIHAILSSTQKKSLTHRDLALRSRIPRSAITGILSGSLQKVSLDRLLRLLEAAELTAELRIRDVA